MLERTTLTVCALLLALHTPSLAAAQAAQEAAPTTDPAATGTEPATLEASEAATDAEPATLEASEADSGTAAVSTPPAGASEVATPSSDETATPRRGQPPRPPLHYHLVIDVGFSHWLGNTFDAPAGIYTPALTVHVLPLDWLEIALQYSGSVLEFTIPTAGRTSQIGFVELSLVLRKELQVGGDLLMLGCGPVVGLVYDVLGVGVAFGAEIVGRFLVQLGNALAVGPFVDLRAILYDLPGDPRPFYEVVDGKVLQGHLDAQVQLGAAVAF
ncbi:MAG: hypothetical protein U0353_34305 [Sandaracinus sp.]